VFVEKQYRGNYDSAILDFGIFFDIRVWRMGSDSDFSELGGNMSEITREQFMLAHCIAGCIQASNPPFCAYGYDEEEVNRDPDYIENVATQVVEFLHGDHMAVEDLIIILEKVLEKFNCTLGGK